MVLHQVIYASYINTYKHVIIYILLYTYNHIYIYVLQLLAKYFYGMPDYEDEWVSISFAYS